MCSQLGEKKKKKESSSRNIKVLIKEELNTGRVKNGQGSAH